jgi:hypothetical protein
MASMNYCLTVCRAAEEKIQQETHSSSSDSVNSPGTGASFFGHFFSFGSTPAASTSQLSNPFTVRASSFTDIDENIF